MTLRIFIIGATGYVGGTLARHFSSEGHDVSGLARSDAGAAALTAARIRLVRGDLDDLPPLLAALGSADVVFYAAQVAFEREPAVLRQICDALIGTGKTLIFLSGTGVLMRRKVGDWSPDVFVESSAFTPEPLAIHRVEAEQIVREAAANDLRSMVIRPPVIWGPGDQGPVAQVYRSVAATGAACYIGTGLAVYGNVHSADLARLFSLAIAHGTAGALYHAVGGETPWRWITEAVAHDLGVPTRRLTMDEAVAVFGPFGASQNSACNRSGDRQGRLALNWAPNHTDMLSQIGEPRLRALATSPTQQEKAE